MRKFIRKIDYELNKENLYGNILRNRKYFAEYTLSENNEIFLSDASCLYINKNHYPKDCINRRICEFTSSDFQKQLKRYIEISNSGKNKFSFFEEDNSELIKITVSVEKSKIILVGKNINVEELSSEKGYVSIKLGKQNNDYIFDLNQEFAKTLKERKISLDSLISSSAFYKALKTMSLYSESFSYQMCQNIYEYRLTAIPVIKNGKILFMNLFLKNVRNINITSALEILTPREKEILNFTAKGCTNRYIAYFLNIKEGTVKKSLHNCYKKLAVSSRSEIIKIFYKSE